MTQTTSAPAAIVGSAPPPITFGRRALDVALSSIGLAGSAPLWAIIAAAVKLQDGGPVFYRQTRIGEGGRIFDALKFRSMRPSASGEPLRAAEEEDPRVTRIGRLLRATAMDELPQLWNILRGDMSFVGPRPLAPGEIERGAGDAFVPIDEIAGFRERCRVRPGLTGVAQIFAPRDVPRRQKFRYDRIYVRNASLWLNVRLIILSFWITFLGTWESRGRKF
jgi:lipopolysaccharide/colanic/teichoic acid biosynthesis glycosyltransferase